MKKSHMDRCRWARRWRSGSSAQTAAIEASAIQAVALSCRKIRDPCWLLVIQVLAWKRLLSYSCKDYNCSYSYLILLKEKESKKSHTFVQRTTQIFQNPITTILFPGIWMAWRGVVSWVTFTLDLPLHLSLSTARINTSVSRGPPWMK